MDTVGLFLLLSAVFGAGGASCPVSSPQCYRKSTKDDEDIHCEWEDQDSSQNAIYTLFIQSSPDELHTTNVKFDRKPNTRVALESVLIASQSDIWVMRRTGDTNCTSAHTYEVLQDAVKYSAPHIQKSERSAGNLKLSWRRVYDNKGAIYEIRWRKINTSWQNDTFETEDSKEAIWDSYSLQLENYSVYQVQVRRKAKKYVLWSDWSQTVDIPVEIQAPVIRWREDKKTKKQLKKQKRSRTITLEWDAPPPEASYGGVTYNLTLNLPCQTKNKTTNRTSYKLAVTDSGARVSIIAINIVSKSASQEIPIPPVPHLKYCHTASKTSPQKKHRCLEWYKLSDNETHPTNVNTSEHATIDDIKKGMDKFVRYYYFIHGKHGSWHTKSMCPIYSAEGAPVAEPKNVTVVNKTHDSAVLVWRPIPVQYQRGFLLHYAIWISREGSDTAYYEVPENQTTVLFRNLTTGISYTVYIAGRTKAGLGPNSTINFLIKPLPFLTSNNGLSKIILSVCGVVLLLSVFFSVALRRLRRKFLPVIPSPVIPSTAFYHLDHQNVKAPSEEVHDVILLHYEEQDKQNNCLNLEQSTLLQHSQLSVYEMEDEEEEKDEEEETQFASSFPNPNYKGQMLKLPEPMEVADKSPEEKNGEVSTPSYRHGSVL